MGVRGRERAEKEFNQEIIIQQSLDVYREIFLINAKCEMRNVRKARIHGLPSIWNRSHILSCFRQDGRILYDLQE